MNNYYSRKEELRKKAVRHTAEMHERYGEKEISECISNSRIYSPETKFAIDQNDQNEPEVRFLNTDSVSAIFACAGEGKTAVLNFASYKNAGGKFIEGSSAQEECLCHESFLYNVVRVNILYTNMQKYVAIKYT